jgi:hypothetical protein
MIKWCARTGRWSLSTSMGVMGLTTASCAVPPLPHADRRRNPHLYGDLAAKSKAKRSQSEEGPTAAGMSAGLLAHIPSGSTIGSLKAGGGAPFAVGMAAGAGAGMGMGVGLGFPPCISVYPGFADPSRRPPPPPPPPPHLSLSGEERLAVDLLVSIRRRLESQCRARPLPQPLPASLEAAAAAWPKEEQGQGQGQGMAQLEWMATARGAEEAVGRLKI